MSTAAIVTIIGVALLFGAIALYLAAIAYTLYKVNFTLGTVLIGVRAIAFQTEPVEQVVGGIAGDVAAIQEALEGLVAALPKPGRTRTPAPRTAPIATRSTSSARPAATRGSGRAAGRARPLGGR